jgi:uncharacterized protein
MKVFLCAALMVLSMGVNAETNTKQAALDELVEIMDMDKLVDSIYSQMESSMQNMSKQMGVKPSEQALFDKHSAEMRKILREGMSWQKMKPHTVELYDRNFSEKEVMDMLAFYKTKTGQSILKKMPVVMQESMTMGQTMMQDVIPKIQALSQQLTADLKQQREQAAKSN